MMFKTTNSNAKLSGNSLMASGDSEVLFTHENESMQKKISLAPNSSLKLFSIYKNSKIKNSFSLGENCRLEIREIFYSGSQIENKIAFEKKSCALNLTAKSVLNENESASYSALASISRSATNANVNLEEHALLLGKNAKATLIPGLEINNDEVNARHASSIRQIDEEQRFYLMSRGLSGKEAEDEMVSGFLSRELGSIKEKFGRIFG